MSTTKHSDRRERLPDNRESINHAFSIGGFDGVLTMGMYHDGRLGEIFVTMSKEGSTVSGIMDSFATVVSIALQYGVPLEALADKMIGQHFEPHGYTGNPNIERCESVVDYIFRVLMGRFSSTLPGI